MSVVEPYLLELYKVQKSLVDVWRFNDALLIDTVLPFSHITGLFVLVIKSLAVVDDHPDGRVCSVIQSKFSSNAILGRPITIFITCSVTQPLPSFNCTVNV